MSNRHAHLLDFIDAYLDECPDPTEAAEAIRDTLSDRDL